MLRAFNFAQQSGYGPADNQTVVPLWLRNGFIDFFTGYYLPINLEGGKDKGFEYGVTAIPISTYATISSGQVTDGNVHLVKFTTVVSGGFVPLLKESAQITYGVSGSVSSGYSDTVPMTTVLSVKISGGNIDTLKTTCLFSSGNITGIQWDTGRLFVSFSGTPTGVNFDNTSLFSSFSGHFVPPYRDYPMISGILYEIDYVDDVTHVDTFDAQDSAKISGLLVQIYYRNY